MHFLKESSRFAQWSLLLLISWVGWRVWRFTITPFLRPNKVKELPYWIPCKSHWAINFGEIANPRVMQISVRIEDDMATKLLID